jgi:hypothetical protein
MKLTKSELWEAMDKDHSKWVETDEETYWDMLEMLPPIKMIKGAFVFLEPLRTDSQGYTVHACFKTVKGRFYGRYMNVPDFDKEF